MVIPYLPDTGWPLQDLTVLGGESNVLQQLKVGDAGSLHPSKGLQVDDLSQWHFTEPRCG